MKSLLLSLAACAALAGCVSYGDPGYGYGYRAPAYTAPVRAYSAPSYAYTAPVYRNSPYYLDQRYDRRGPLGDFDGDGIANRHDADRDGDGVHNRYDRRPGNPSYR